MFKTIKEAVSKIVIPVFLENGFVLGKDGCNTYYRKSENYLEIIYIGPTKYGNSYVVRASIVYLSNNEKNNNIDYRLFTGNIDEIIPDECIKEYYMKGCFGTDEFFFHNVYYDIGMGVGVTGVAKNAKKPFGIRLQKYDDNTYGKVCNKIVKKMPKLLKWLDNMKTKNKHV